MNEELPTKPTPGPTLQSYVETRLDLMAERMDELKGQIADRANEMRLALDGKLEEINLRYQQRFEAQQIAILKSETATEKRLEGVNEFRQTLSDQTINLMTRVEAMALINSLTEKIDDTKNRVITIESVKLGGKEQKDGMSQTAQIIATIIGILVPASVLIVAMSKVKGAG